jgi:hypothetical protein
MVSLTKKEFIHISKNNFYDFFDIPFERIQDYIYSEMVPLNNKRKEPKKSRKQENYFITYDTWYSMQGIGTNHSMYGKHIVPISIYTLERKQGQNISINIRYVGHSIDDYSQGFWMNPKNGKTLEDGYNIIKEYLYKNPLCEDNYSFEHFFNQFKKDFEIDYDYD